MSDDFGSSSLNHPKKRKHKKGKSSRLTDAFDAEWDSIPNKPKPKPIIDPPKPIQDEQQSNDTDTCPIDHPHLPSDSDSSMSSVKSSSKKKKKKKNKKNDSTDNTDGGGGVTAIYSADKTTHVIEYGIQHDKIRKGRANTKAIKDKIRKKREEEKKKEQEALKKHKEAMERLKNLKTNNKKSKSKKTMSAHGVETTKKETLEFGMSDAVKAKRAEIKAIKEKRRKSKLQTSVSSSPSLKPSKLAKDKSLSKGKKEEKRKSIKLDENSIFSSLKEENMELKKQLKMSEFIKKKYDILKNENNLYKEQVTVLNEENQTLKEELAAMRGKLDAMKKKNANENESSDGDADEEVMEEKKVEKVENAKVAPAENESDDEEEDEIEDGVVSPSSSNSSEEEEENEWEEWEYNQICDWVIGIDAKYKKYEKIIKKNMKSEEIHGSILDALQDDDFERFGITSAKHRKVIMAALHNLVSTED